MSASKKSTSKSTSPAPATKSAAKSAPKKKAPVAAVKTAPVPPTPPAPKVSAPAAKPVPARPITTTIKARIDVGFGNALFIRGEGAGLSWDQGRAMECVADDLWRVSLPETTGAFTFKFLINDLTWSAGPDFSAASGATVTLVPEFA